MSKKRGKIPSLITGSSGKPIRVIAKRQRMCSRCSCSIASGNNCFEVPKVGGGFSNKKTYCRNCFGEILKKTKEDLALLELEIED